MSMICLSKPAMSNLVSPSNTPFIPPYWGNTRARTLYQISSTSPTSRSAPNIRKRTGGSAVIDPFMDCNLVSSKMACGSGDTTGSSLGTCRCVGSSRP